MMPWRFLISFVLAPAWFFQKSFKETCTSHSHLDDLLNTCHVIDLIFSVYVHSRVPCHIVHLSSASALPMIRKAREEGVPLTIETTHHYLSLLAEDVPDGATQFKCCPPVRDAKNQVSKNNYSTVQNCICASYCFKDRSKCMHAFCAQIVA